MEGVDLYDSAHLAIKESHDLRKGWSKVSDSKGAYWSMRAQMIITSGQPELEPIEVLTGQARLTADVSIHVNTAYSHFHIVL